MRLIRLLKNDIAKEAAEWVRAELITQAQAEKICARYDVDYHQAQNHSFAYQVLIGLGYLFIGLSVITLLGANWDDIPRAVRMWGLIALTLAVQAWGIQKIFVQQYSTATGIFLLGNLFFGAAIILIAQIYHLGEHMPDGVFWWALGTLPIALILNNTWLMLQTMILALIWFVLEVSLNFYPYLFPIFLFSGLWILIRGRESILLFLSIVIGITLLFEYTLSEYWRIQYYYDFHVEHLLSSVSLFIFAYTFSHWLNRSQSIKAQDYAAVLAVWSLRFGLVLLLILSFEAPWEELILADWENQTSMLLVVGILSLAAFFLALISQKLNPSLVIIAFYLVSVFALLNAYKESQAIYFQITYNLVLISAGIVLILKGIQQGISHYFFLGISTILVTALMRYIDLIGDYIGGAILFMVFAILLLGAAKYWKRHQQKDQSHNSNQEMG